MAERKDLKRVGNPPVISLEVVSTTEIEKAAFKCLNYVERHAVIHFLIMGEALEKKEMRRKKRNVTREERQQIVKKVERRVPGSEEAMNKFMDYYNHLLSEKLAGIIH